MKRFYVLIFFFALLGGCSERNADVGTPPLQQPEPPKIKNEVLVLGTVHSSHLREEAYSLDVLTNLIRKIDPDLILTEIPPDRFPIAMEEFQTSDTITEPRVSLFPEYVDVIFPLSKEMDFTIIPTAGWTKEMADSRRRKIQAIKDDPKRAKDWEQYMAAGDKSDSLRAASGREYDPYWINSPQYDEYAEVGLSVYNELFNEELGLGGWDNINQAHYDLITKALDDYQYQGKRILITYGAGHKGWFLRELSKRNDIVLKSLTEMAGPPKD